MADKKSAKPNPAPTQAQGQGQVIQLKAEKCTAVGCKAKPEKAQFCSEHFVWFKEGLLTLQGQKAKDFDKKYHAWMKRKAA